MSEKVSVTTTGEVYVDTYMEEQNIFNAEGINSCIAYAIANDRKVVFTKGNTYTINEPITISNESNTTKSINIDFNGAIITAVTDEPLDYLVKLTAASNNGNVVSHISNFRADASCAQYGIYATKAIRLRMDNIDITNNVISTVTKFWCGTQSQYDAISVKDPNTVYMIHE